MNCDSLWINVHVSSCVPGAPDGYGIVRDAALAVTGERIVWVGPRRELPAQLRARTTHDGHGHWLTPGLIDCHTHLVFAGDRAAEFEARLSGATYAEIARAGGGITATVAATRAATRSELLGTAGRRARALAAEGVTLVEVKSGYGLNEADELKILEVARQLPAEAPLRVATTLLAAHALPPEFAGRSADYIEMVCTAIVPAAAQAGLADAVDAFCESIGFSPEETAAVFNAARAAGLPVKLHADQLSDGGGAALAARHGALSADHLEYTSARGVAALAAAGSVAVLLPGAFYFLRETRLPPVEKLRRAGVPMALATDCNPGSSPCTSLLLMLNMACTLFRLTPAEALLGVTSHAARALGQAADCGRLAPGYRADCVLWDVEHPRELAYAFGANPRVGTLLAGAPLP